MSRKWVVSFLVAALGGCADDLSRPSLLDGIRVLGVLTNLQEVGPRDTLEVTPVVYSPSGVISVTQSLCPLSTGARGGYACALETCESEPLDPTARTGRFDVGPLLLSCAEKLQLDLSAPVGAGVDSVQRVGMHVSILAKDDAAETRAIQRVTFVASGTVTPNLPPVVLELAIDGVPTSTESPQRVRRDEPIELAIRLATGERFVDEGGRDRTEGFVVSWYATGGEFEADRTDGEEGDPLVRNTWTPAGSLDSGRVELWLGIRDDREGQAVFGPVWLDPS